jgi:hypothetical protein
VARSTSIWVVKHHDALVAAFTVKHEMIAWLEVQSALDDGWWVVKLSDNPDRYQAHEPITFPAEHFVS